MNFSQSELYCIRDAVKAYLDEWDKTKVEPVSDEVSAEMVKIITEVEHQIEHNDGCCRALDVLVNHPRRLHNLQIKV